MAYELREGQGSLFKNDRKSQDNHPSATGTALIGGVLYEISSWTKEGRNGKFQSLSFKPKQQRQAEPQQRRQSYAEQSGGTAREPGDPDLPF